MLKKKKNKPELSPEEALNKRVDAMMDPKSSGMPPLDIFKDKPTGAAKTAPEVSGALLTKVDTTATAEPIKKPRPPVPTPAPKPAVAPIDGTTLLDDQTTDKAVDDISAHEGDTILALQDAISRKKSRQADEGDSGHRGIGIGWALLLLAAIVLFLLAVPYTRYTCRWPVGIRLRVITNILPSVCK